MALLVKQSLNCLCRIAPSELPLLERATKDAIARIVRSVIRMRSGVSRKKELEKGLSMGRTLAGLFPGRFTHWRFDSMTYQASVQVQSGPVFDEFQLVKLGTMEMGWDSRLCSKMCEVGRKVHQESFVDWLLEDGGHTLVVTARESQNPPKD